MATKDKTATETALATLGPAAVEGPTLETFTRIIGKGFSSIDTVLLGDPNQGGKVPMYVGLLIGPGEPIEVGEPDPKTGVVNTMPTFAFHPVIDENGGTVENVTHVIPMSHVPAHACARIFREVSEGGSHAGMKAIVGLVYIGKGVTRKGYQLNNFRVFERYDKAA